MASSRNISDDDEQLVIDLSDEQPSQHQQHQQQRTQDQEQSQAPTSRQLTKGNLFTIFQIIENIYLLGIDSLVKWEKMVVHLKTNREMLSNPVLIQLSFTLQQLLQVFQNHINNRPDICDEEMLFIESEVTRSFAELIKIFQPVLKKSVIDIVKYPFNTVQCFMTIVRQFLQQSTTTTKRKSVNDSSKISKKKGKLNFSKDIVPSDLSDSSASSCDEDDDNDNFAKLFKKTKHEPLVISQHFTLQTGNVRKKISTPGETGTHLIKIEISDIKDLKKCKSERFYWQKVSKKGYFLLNISKEDEAETLHSICNILTNIGNKILKLKNVKKESIILDQKKD